MARARVLRQAVHHQRLATQALSLPLAPLESGGPSRTTAHRQGNPRAYPPLVSDESDLGFTAKLARAPSGRGRYRSPGMGAEMTSRSPNRTWSYKTRLTSLGDVDAVSLRRKTLNSDSLRYRSRRPSLPGALTPKVGGALRYSRSSAQLHALRNTANTRFACTGAVEAMVSSIATTSFRRTV